MDGGGEGGRMVGMKAMDDRPVAIVGAGFYGAVMAERFAEAQEGIGEPKNVTGKEKHAKAR